jgi:hypothetical protein
MENELSIVDEVMIIDKMLIKLGYNTDKMSVDEVLDIRKALKNAIGKTDLALRDNVETHS